MKPDPLDELAHLAGVDRATLADFLARQWPPGEAERCAARLADHRNAHVLRAAQVRRLAPRKHARLPELVEHVIASGEARNLTAALDLLALRLSRSVSQIRKAYYEAMRARSRENGSPTS